MHSHNLHGPNYAQTTARQIGLYLISHFAAHNHVVTKVAASEPMRKELDVDLGTPLANTMRQEQLQAKRIKWHRREREAKDKKDIQDMWYHNIMNGLAKQVAKLVPQDIVFTSLANIHMVGGEALTAARKWILKLHRQHEVPELH